MGTGPRRLEIDWTRCDGHGLCSALAPEHIGRDEWGFPLIDRRRMDERTAKALVDVCPALALRLESTNGTAAPQGAR